jgi:hypothetical protein
MKKILTLLAVTLATSVYAVDTHADADAAKGQTKQVCHDVLGKDNQPVKNKDGSVKQQCKTIKVHQKFEGTEIPAKK